MKTVNALILSAALIGVAAPAAAGGFQLSSPDIQPGGSIGQRFVFNGFGCHGGDQSPALSWKDAPAGTRSFALMVYDPDAPTGSGWWHWAVANIPAATHHLPRNAGRPDSQTLPHGAIQLRTDFGINAYGGPCPPAGDTPHHYQFKLFALDVPTLPVKPDNSPAMLGFMVHQHSLGVAELDARYGH